MSNTSITLRKRCIRVARRLMVVLVLIYVGACTAIYFKQDWIAFPGASEQGTPQTRFDFGEKVRLTTKSGIPIVATFSETDQPDRPTILYFYGNAGSVAWSQNEFDHFRKLGCNVMIPDLSGYGQSGGKAGEAHFYATADAAWDYLQTRPGVNPKQIIVVGWSMGAGIAIDLASRKTVAGLATFNAFTTLPAMARVVVPWAPTGLLLRYRFDNLSKIAGIHCPVLICNGQLDELVPTAMSDQLAAAAGGRVTRLVIGSADHNSIFVADPDKVWNALRDWIATIKS